MGLSFWISDYTLRNAVLGAALLGLTSGVLSTFAVLRRQSLLGDALSHAALPGICLGFLIVGSRQLLPIFIGALVSGAVAALLLLLLTRRSRLKEDAGLGIVLSVFFALGIVLLTYIQGQRGAGQAGLETFLFGQAAAILPSDLRLMGTVSTIALGLILVSFKELKLLSFDPEYARSLGLPVTLLDIGLTLLIAVAVVIGLQLVGVVLMSAMLVAPGAAARQWSKHLGQMVLFSALFATISGVLGALLSAERRGLATGPIIVLALSSIVLISLFFAPQRGLVWSALQARRERLNLRSQRVLLTLYHLSQEHQDPHYPSEQGMLNALYGHGTEKQLTTLEEQGLVVQAAHMKEEGTHWILTEAGRQSAETLQQQIHTPHAKKNPAHAHEP